MKKDEPTVNFFWLFIALMIFAFIVFSSSIAGELSEIWKEEGFIEITGLIVQDSCTDSDGGLNYDVKGYVNGYRRGRRFVASDQCLEGMYKEYLKEYYCEGNTPRAKRYRCSYECEDGACTKEVTCSCGPWQNDVCGGGRCPSNQMRQFRYCLPSGCAIQEMCVSDPGCVVTPSCTDSDGGKNYYVKGTVTLSSESRTDYCRYRRVLVEFYCDEEGVGSEIHACSGRCSDGACEEPAGQSYQIPVLVISYIPLTSEGKVNTLITGDIGTDDINVLREHISKTTDLTVEALTKGSAYHGYKNSSAVPSLQYSLYEHKEFLKPVPTFLTNAQKVVDGDPETGKWHPEPPYENDYLLIDMHSIKQLNKITLYFWYIDRPESFHIDASTTGDFNGEEQRVVTETNGLDGYSKISPTLAIEKKDYAFDPVNTRFIKLTVDKYRNDGSNNGQINLYEFSTNFGISNAEVTSNEGFGESVPADHIEILKNQGFNICDYVENHGVKEVWIWMYHTDKVYPVESYQRGPNHSLGNGYMDLPLCQKSYAVYDYNYGRAIGEAIEDHTHHIEAVMRYIDSYIWDNLFVGVCGPQSFYRCGWTHYPPNVMEFCLGHDYDWYNERIVLSDCEDWRPDGSGEKKEVNCETWKDAFINPDRYSVPGRLCPEDGGVAFKVWWMQNIPGMSNNLEYQGKRLRNWWDFIGNFDATIQSGRCLACA